MDETAKKHKTKCNYKAKNFRIYKNKIKTMATSGNKRNRACSRNEIEIISSLHKKNFI